MTGKGQVIKIYDDASTLKVLRMHKGKTQLRLYVNADPGVNLVMIKILICYSSNPKDDKPYETKYFTTQDPEVENVVLFFDDISPNGDEMGFKMDADVGGGDIRLVVVLMWVLKRVSIIMFVVMLELKWILMMILMMKHMMIISLLIGMVLNFIIKLKMNGLIICKLIFYQSNIEWCV